MTKNPLINALSATAYIALIVILMNLITQPLANKPDTQLTSYLAPIVMLSLLTLSVAVMAFIFFYEPALLLIEKNKKEAITLFAKTVGIFAIFTTISLVLIRFIL